MTGTYSKSRLKIEFSYFNINYKIFQIVEKRKKHAKEKADKAAEEEEEEEEENILQPYAVTVPNVEVTKLMEAAEAIIGEFSGKLQWIEGIYSPPTQQKGITTVDGEGK